MLRNKQPRQETAYCTPSEVYLGWASTGEIAQSTETEHTDGQVGVHHSAEQVIDKHLHQRHVTSAALTYQLSTDKLIQ